LNVPCDGNAAFTGQSVLDDVASSYNATWVPNVNGRPFTSPTVVTFEYAGGKIECTPAMKSMGGAPDRPASLRLEVATTFNSANGVLAESLTGTVTRFFGSSIVTFNGSIAEAEKKGTLELLPMPGYTIRVAFAGDLGNPDPTSLTGSVIQQGMSGSMGQVKNLGAFQQ
jgi:hypothetical protein